MKNRFRLLSALLCLVLAVSSVNSTMAFALDDSGTYEDTNGNVFSYEKIGSTRAAIVGYSSSKANSSVTIPLRIGPLIVTQIGDGRSSVFPNAVTSVTLPKEAKTVSEEAFSGTSLKSITLNSDLTEIGDSAFEGCDELTQISIPDGVKKVGEKAFKGCSKLTSARLGKNTSNIGDSAFEDCVLLTSVTLPDELRSIGKNAFDDCEKLDTITVPGSVTSIGEDAFYADNLDLQIKGYKNSKAEEYAKKNKIYFTSIGTYDNKYVSISTNSISVTAGGTANFTVYNPSTGISVKIGDEKIAKVSVSGSQVFVTGVSAGYTTITVSAGSGYNSEQVGVTVTAPAGGSYPLTIDTPSYCFNAKDIYYVKAKTNAAVPPSATSNIPEVVSVKYVTQKPDGYVYQIKGESAGGAIITFTSGGQTVTMSVSVSAYGSGNLTCDTTVNFSKKRGQIYTFKMTVFDTYAKPSFTVGNGSVLKTYAQKHVGNDYYFQIIAAGKPGESTGVYTSFPGQPAVKHCTVFIAS